MMVLLLLSEGGASLDLNMERSKLVGIDATNCLNVFFSRDS